MPAVLDHAAVTAATADLPDWRHFGDSLHARFDAPDFITAIRLVDQIASAAEQMNHHPDLDIRWKKVTCVLSTHSEGGVTDFDVMLAGRISSLASAAGATSIGSPLSKLEIAIDCLDPDAIREFWRIGLDRREERTADGNIALADPAGAGPDVWFQQMTQPRTGRNRIHLDLYLPEASARDRVDAVIAAGGRLVTDKHAPSWWVLADVEGNELCVCV